MKKITIIFFLIFMNSLIAQKNNFEIEKFNSFLSTEKYDEAITYIYKICNEIDEDKMSEGEYAYMRYDILKWRHQIINSIENKNKVEGINWMTYEAAKEKQKTNPKKIIILSFHEFSERDMSDRVKKTILEDNYRNIELVKYVNQNFYAVKTNYTNIKSYDIKFPEKFIEFKRKREAELRQYLMKYESKKERRERENKEKKEGVKIALNFYPEDFIHYVINSFSNLLFIDETGNYIHYVESFPNLKQLEYHMKLIGSNKYEQLKTEEEFQEYYENLEYIFIN